MKTISPVADPDLRKLNYYDVMLNIPKFKPHKSFKLLNADACEMRTLEAKLVYPSVMRQKISSRLMSFNKCNNIECKRESNDIGSRRVSVNETEYATPLCKDCAESGLEMKVRDALILTPIDSDFLRDKSKNHLIIVCETHRLDQTGRMADLRKRLIEHVDAEYAKI